MIADSLQIHQIQRGGLPTLAQLLESGAPHVALTLIALGGLVWLICYIAVLRTGHRDQAPAIPIAAVCLNITWEIVHSVVYPPPRQIDLVTNLAWLALDLFVLLQVFRYGRRWQTIPEIQRRFPLVILGTLLIAFVGHVTFHRHVTANSIFPDESGSIPAFIINLVMSVLFIAMYFSRPQCAGLSKTVAWTKFIGSALYGIGNAMILMRIPVTTYLVQVKAPGSDTWVMAGEVGSTTIHPGLVYFLAVGIAIFDIIYLLLLYRGPHSAHRAPATP